MMSTPKGFDKFFRRPGANKPTPDGGSDSSNNEDDGGKNGNSADSTFKSKESKGSGSGGSGGDKKPPTDGNKVPDFVTTALLIGAALFMTDTVEKMNKKNTEISWKSFERNLLEKGLVDRIVVTNKTTAKIILHTPESFALSQSQGENKNFANPFVALGDGSSTAGSSRKNSNSNNGWADVNPPGGEGFSVPGSFGAIAPEQSGEGASGNVAADLFNKVRSAGQSAAPATFTFNIGTVEAFERKLEEAQKDMGLHPRDFVSVTYTEEQSMTNELMRYGPTLLLIGGMIYMSRGMMGGPGGAGGGPGGMFGIGKSKAKKFSKENVTTTFKDVAGCDEAKREIMEFVSFLKEPKRFTRLGAKIPKGALLCGAPGTGKTMLAKATAGEANVPFYSVSGSDFVEMFVGVGPSRVRDLFKEARENAPCILFIDEIDGVGGKRGKGAYNNDERENTLNALLVEMDGFNEMTNIIVLAGTNRPDMLDPALRRPGRFDRQITVEKPDIKGRKEIFDVYLKNITIEGDIAEYSSRLAALTPGFVGADISNICNEAAIIAARKDKKFVDLTDFESATDRVIGGLESKKIMSPEELRTVAYHEAGHAVAGWNLKHADPLLKVTIVPRGNGALGFAQYLPKELFLRTREQLLDIVCMALAGRASEEINFGKVTTGASDDLRRVTQIVYQMVQVYGMNEEIGQLAFPKDEGGGFPDRMYSEHTAELMDKEVKAIVDEAYQRTLNLMKEHQEQVRLVAELLLKKETITNLDVTELIGQRPYPAGKEYDEYVNSGWGSKVAKASSDAAEAAAAAAAAVRDSVEGVDDIIKKSTATGYPTY